jgi:hypothetical protein
VVSSKIVACDIYGLLLEIIRHVSLIFRDQIRPDASMRWPNNEVCMNKVMLRVFFLSLALAVLSGCAGSSKYMVQAEKPQLAADQNKATVFIMRPSGIGFAINFQIWDSDRFVGLSQGKSYLRYVCDPGKHLFIAIAENKTYMPADLEAGRIYYVLTSPRMGVWKARVSMNPVKKGSEDMSKVQEWMSDLEYIVRVSDTADAHEANKKSEIMELVNRFNSLSPQEKAEYPVIIRDDGI